MARAQERHRNGGRHAASARRAEAEREDEEGVIEQAGEAAESMGRHAEEMGREAAKRADEGGRQFAAMGERAFEAWMQSTNDALQRVLEVNMELANWGREQLDDSISAVRSLSQCRTVGDAYGVQIGLMRVSMEKSLRHANNVFSLATQAMTGAMQRGQRTGSEAIEQTRSHAAD